MKSLACTLLAIACSVATPAVAFDASTEWTRFLGTGSYSDANSAFDALSHVRYVDNTVDASACREHAKALADAVRTVPVSIALRHAQLLCGEALDDVAAAESASDALAALLAHGRDKDAPLPWRAPVRVVRPEDVDAYLALAQLERRYAYYSQLWPTGELPIYVAVRDADGPERHLAFDWVDTLARLSSKDRFQGMHMDRHIIANDFLNAWARDEDIAAVDLLAAREARQDATLDVRRDRLRAAAARGGLLSAQSWFEVCRRNPSATCADGLVDALIPGAEAGHALARVQLAAAYHFGIGIARDPAAARKLVESAERSMQDGQALTYFATMFDLADTALPEWLAQSLAAADAHPSGLARERRIRRAIDAGTAVSNEDREWLAAPQRNGRGLGYILLARLADLEKSKDVDTWTEKAARAGQAEALRIRAFARLREAPRDAEAASWLLNAARDGDSFAVRGVSWQALEGGKAAAARDWLFGKVVEGDLDAILMLADVYADGPSGIDEGPKDAVEIYRDIHEESPDARRKLALMLLDGRGAEADPAQARALLQAASDDESKRLLAALRLSGRIAGEAAEGRAWFDTAVAAGDTEAMGTYGLHLANRGGTAAERSRGVELLRRAADAEVEDALNNLAWVRCVSRHGDVRNPVDGLEAARRMGPTASMGAGHVDTVAACHAATGDYTAAVRVQQEAIDGLPGGQVFEPTRKRMQERKALYARRQAYVEAADDTD